MLGYPEKKKKKTKAPGMLERGLLGYMGHRRPKLQAVSAHAPTHLLPAPTLSCCGGGSSTKTERREETGVGCGAHRDGELRRDDRPAFPIPADEVTTVPCGKWAELSFLSTAWVLCSVASLVRSSASSDPRVRPVLRMCTCRVGSSRWLQPGPDEGTGPGVLWK